VKQRLLTVALNSILMFVACRYWKSQGINVVWKVVTLDAVL